MFMSRCSDVHQHLVFSVFLVPAILMDKYLYLIVVLVYIPFISNETGHVHMHLIGYSNIFMGEG